MNLGRRELVVASAHDVAEWAGAIGTEPGLLGQRIFGRKIVLDPVVATPFPGAVSNVRGSASEIADRRAGDPVSPAFADPSSAR